MTKPKDKIPNIITTTRILLVLNVAIAIIQNNKRYEILLCTGFIYISDLLDGYMARKLNVESILGRRLDVIADGLYVIGITAIFTYNTIISPVVLGCIIIEYLVFVFTAKILSSKGHLIYDAIGRFVAAYYYILTGFIIIVWMKDIEAAVLLQQLSLICVGLTVIGCACRLQVVYIMVLNNRR